MLKTVLITVGLITAVVFGYIAWVVSHAVNSTNIGVSTETQVTASQITVIARLSGTDREFEIREITFPRTWGEELEIEPPSGFKEQPFALDDTDDPTAPESREWIKKKNLEVFRWIGAAKFLPDQPVTLTFPIKTLVSGEGEILFQYEGKIGMSGSLSFFRTTVKVNER